MYVKNDKIYFSSENMEFAKEVTTDKPILKIKAQRKLPTSIPTMK